MAQPPFTRKLLNMISQQFTMTSADQQELVKELVRAQRQAWRTEIERQLSRHGVEGARVFSPCGEDFNRIRRVARSDAASIRRTFNRDLNRQIEKLFAANRRGNRFYYRKNICEWIVQRDTWKGFQIGLNTETTMRFEAMRLFRERNGIARLTKYRFIGPAPPRCDICVEQFNKGEVDWDEVIGFPTPLHVNCPHEWDAVTIVNLAQQENLWTGRC